MEQASNYMNVDQLESIIVISFAISAVVTFINEAYGINMQYGRFATSSKQGEKKESNTNASPSTLKVASLRDVPSRTGMLVIYTPALIGSILFPYFVKPIESLMAINVEEHQPLHDVLYYIRWLLIIHFLKRDLEVMFIHKYSGYLDAASMIMISTSYLSMSMSVLFGVALFSKKDISNQGYDSWFIVGTVLYVVGELGNFYHHYLLANLRKDESKEGVKKYSIPAGGLFEFVTCPHYLFELVAWYGIAIVANNLITFSISLSMT